MIKFFRQKENKFILSLAILMILWTNIFANKTIGDFLPDGGAKIEKQVSSNFVVNSVGGDIFKNFYSGLKTWFKGDGIKDGVFQKFASEIKPLFETVFTIAVMVIGIAMYFGKFVEHSKTILKYIISTIIFLSFLEYDTFAYWIFDPMLEFLISIMKVLFDVGGNVGLSEAIFSVDKHFSKLFSAISDYWTRIDEAESWYEFHLMEFFFLIGMILGFGALYGIFTILIIVGFFGYMLMLGFAPIFMAIGVFNKNIFMSWVKTSFNYFLIPIFTAAVMSITVQFTDQAAEFIKSLQYGESLFTKEVGYVFMVAVFSVGLHWKAPEFAAGISGGMASGAGSIVGTATALGGAAWGISKKMPGAATNIGSGISGGSWGNQGSKGYQAGRSIRSGADMIGRGTKSLWDKYRSGTSE